MGFEAVASEKLKSIAIPLPSGFFVRASAEEGRSDRSTQLDKGVDEYGREE